MKATFLKGNCYWCGSGIEYLQGAELGMCPVCDRELLLEWLDEGPSLTYGCRIPAFSGPSRYATAPAITPGRREITPAQPADREPEVPALDAQASLPIPMPDGPPPATEPGISRLLDRLLHSPSPIPLRRRPPEAAEEI